MGQQGLEWATFLKAALGDEKRTSQKRWRAESGLETGRRPGRASPRSSEAENGRLPTCALCPASWDRSPEPWTPCLGRGVLRRNPE